MSEVWFRSFDKPHGVSGEGRVNHEALREAIVSAARSAKWREPKFLEIADAYKREALAVRMELDRVRVRSEEDREKKQVAIEHDRRVERIREWSDERLTVAMELVGRRFPTFAHKSKTPSAWSNVFSGLIIAADEEIREAKA